MSDKNLAEYMYKEITGEEFCTLFPDLSKRLVKLTNDKENHNGFQFLTGLNIDNIKFNPTSECTKGGIYFTDIDNLPRWLEYNDCVMKYYRTLTLPPDSRVYIEENKFKADKIILGDKVEIEKLDCWLDEEYCLKALGFNNYRSWRYIKNENALFGAINRGKSIAHMLKNRATISEKVLRYSMTKNSFFPSVDWSAEYSDSVIYASEYGHLDLVQFLLSDEIREKYPKIDPIANNNKAIIPASENGHIDVVKFLLSNEIIAKYPKIDPSSYVNEAIISASENGHIEIVKFLLSDEISARYPNIDPSAFNNQAIISASENGHIEIVKFLLSDEISARYPNIDPCACNNDAIRSASGNGHIEIVKFLLSDMIRAKYSNIDPSTNYNQAIILASKNGHFEVVKYLLSDEILKLYPKIDPSAKDNYAIRFASQ